MMLSCGVHHFRSQSLDKASDRAELDFFGVGQKNPLTGRVAYNFRWFPTNRYSVFNGDTQKMSKWMHAEGLKKQKCRKT